MSRQRPIKEHYGWGVYSDRWGQLWTDFHGTRSSLIKALEKEFKAPWQQVRRQYKLRAVKVRLSLAEVGSGEQREPS